MLEKKKAMINLMISAVHVHYYKKKTIWCKKMVILQNQLKPKRLKKNL